MKSTIQVVILLRISLFYGCYVLWRDVFSLSLDMVWYNFLIHSCSENRLMFAVQKGRTIFSLGDFPGSAGNQLKTSSLTSYYIQVFILVHYTLTRITLLDRYKCQDMNWKNGVIVSHQVALPPGACVSEDDIVPDMFDKGRFSLPCKSLLTYYFLTATCE